MYVFLDNISVVYFAASLRAQKHMDVVYNNIHVFLRP